MASSISYDDLMALYNDLTAQGYDHATLVNAARQNYGVDLDAAIAQGGGEIGLSGNAAQLQNEAAQAQAGDYRYEPEPAPAAPQGGLSQAASYSNPENYGQVAGGLTSDQWQSALAPQLQQLQYKTFETQDQGGGGEQGGGGGTSYHSDIDWEGSLGSDYANSALYKSLYGDTGQHTDTHLSRNLGANQSILDNLMRDSYQGESTSREIANDLDSWRNAIRAAAPGATEDQINAKLAEYTNKGAYDPETGQYGADTVNAQRAYSDLNTYLANQQQGGWDWAGKVADSTIGKGRARAEGSFNYGDNGLDLDESSLRAYRGSNVDAENIQKAMMAAQVIGAATGLPIGQIMGAIKGAATGDWLGAAASGLGAMGGLGMIDPSIGQYANLANNAAKGNWLGAAMGGMNMAGGMEGLRGMFGDNIVDSGDLGGFGGANNGADWSGGNGLYDDWSLEDFEHLTGGNGGGYDFGGSGDDWTGGGGYGDVGGGGDWSGGGNAAGDLGAGDDSMFGNDFQVHEGSYNPDFGYDDVGEVNLGDDQTVYTQYGTGGDGQWRFDPETGERWLDTGNGGNLEQDFVVDDRGQIIDSGGNTVETGLYDLDQVEGLNNTIGQYNFGGGGGEIGGGGNLTGGGWQGPTGPPTKITRDPYRPGTPTGTPPGPGGLGGLAGAAIGMINRPQGPTKRPISPQPPPKPPTKPPVSPPPGGTQPPGGSQPPPPGTPGGGVMGGVGGNIGSGGTGLYSMQPLMQNQGQNIKSTVSNQGATGLYNPQPAVNQFAQSWNSNAATNPAQGQGGAMARGGLAHFADGGSAIDPMGSTPMASPSYYSFGSPTFHNFGEAGAYADGGEVLSDIEDLVRQKLFMDQNQKAMQQHQQAAGIQSAPPVQAFAGGGSAHPMGEPLFMSEGASVNHYVQGPGTGQSDDIPAMLADGEYVLDAETVAALGDGSNKAGAQVLDQWRQQIRAHKRGGGLASIPPKSLGPDGYMAKVRGGMR